jgi:signal transduction histidine kinase
MSISDELKDLVLSMLKRFVSLLIILAATLSMHASIAVGQKEPLVFVCDKNYPPMTYLENGQPKGVVVDILRALEQRIGMPIDLRLMDWSKAQELIAQGQAIGLCQMSITEARKKSYDFSDPVITLHFSIFTRNNKKSLSDISELRGLLVGVTPGGLPHSLLESDHQINFVDVDDYEQGFQMLKDGKIDAVFGDHWVGSYVLAEKGIMNIQTNDDVVAKLPSAIALKKGNAALLGVINQGLAALKEDGTLARIYSAWQPQEVIYETRQQAVRKIYFFSISFLVLLLVGTVGWLITMKREVAERAKSDDALERNRSRLRKLSAHIEQIKEEQRIRIAREIHDDLGGNLVAIKMVLHTMQNRSTFEQSWLTEKFHYIETLIDHTIETGHRIVLELRPGVLDLGIIPALEWLAQEFEKQNNIPCNFSTNNSDIELSPEHEAALFRMVQEALTNIAKHAKATNASVTIDSTETCVTTTVKDNGCGLTKDHENKPNSFGLLGMSERCKEIGAAISIRSQPGKGCAITIKIPMLDKPD